MTEPETYACPVCMESHPHGECPSRGLEGKEIHVCRGVGRYYTAQARRARARKFESVGEKYRTAHGAARELAAALLRGDGVEGQVIAWSDWYEPAVVLELRRT